MGDKDQVGTSTSLYCATAGETPFRNDGGQPRPQRQPVYEVPQPELYDEDIPF